MTDDNDPTLEPPRVPDDTSGQHPDFPDLDLTAPVPGLDLPHADADGTRPGENLQSFYDQLINEPRYAAMSARFKATVAMYAHGETIQTICDVLGISRTEVALAIRRSGVRRGMDNISMPPEDVASLYALLYAAQMEIERLRRQAEGL